MTVSPRWRPWRGLAALALAALLPLVAACETAPATGRSIFTGGLTPEREEALGLEQHEEVLKEFGGAYDDPELAAYVQSIGDFLVKTSETPNESFTFTVLDTPMVNAFALPGGYVYVTRGLMALARDEAELAGVIGHEIGHVTARHAAERYGQAVAATAANLGVGLLLGGQAAQATGLISQLTLKSYSRDQEFEADTLGVRYMSRAGYRPDAMGSFLEQLLDHSRLEADVRDARDPDSFDFMQTHPRTSDRIERAIQAAGVKRVDDPIRAQDIYYDKIDGMIYGDNPEQGVIRGRDFIHPDLRFRFRVPEDFRLINGQRQVQAIGPNNSLIVFDGTGQARSQSMTGYIRDEWAAKLSLSGLEAIEINGLPAATAATRLNSSSGPVDLRLVAIRFDPRTVYRFIFASPPAVTAGLSDDFQRTTYSFRRISADEAAQVTPYRLRIHRVRAGESLQDLADRMALEDHALDRFLVLNGLTRGSVLQPGQKVKLVGR